jgi:hypothetical protein
MAMALRDGRALTWFSEVIYKSLRFLHSVLVKRGADQNFFRSHSYVFLDALLRQEQSERLVRLDFLLEEQDRTSSRLIHSSPLACLAACLQKDESRLPHTPRIISSYLERDHSAMACGSSLFRSLRLAYAPTWIRERECKSPKTSKSHKTTPITTTAFKIDLIDPAIGMKLLTSHSRTPTTIRAINI